MITIKIKGKEFVEVDREEWLKTLIGESMILRDVCGGIKAYYIEKKYLPKKCSKCNGTGVVK